MIRLEIKMKNGIPEIWLCKFTSDKNLRPELSKQRRESKCRMVIVIQSWSVILSSSFLLNYLSLVIAVSTVLHTVYQDTTTTQAFCNSNYDALLHPQEKNK